jgi:protein TonB
MFTESLVESTTLLRSRNRLPAILSVVLQAVVVAAVIALPLLHPEVLPATTTKLATLAAPPVRTPPPPVERPHVVPSTATATTAPSAPSQAIAAIRNILNVTGSSVDTPILAAGPNIGPTNPALPPGLNPGAPNVSVQPTAAPATLRISSGVTAGLLLAPIHPDYPSIAKISRTEGTVIIQAIIGKDGHITSARVLSGPVMLQAAALDAVRSAHYHPYLLNNQPTEVETTINITFRLNS